MSMCGAPNTAMKTAALSDIGYYSNLTGVVKALTSPTVS